MRKRVPIAVGGGIALLIASQYFNFGLGFRDGNEPGRGDQEAGQVSIDPSVSRSAAPRPTETPAEDDAAMRAAAQELQRETAEPPRPQVVDILIDGNQYRVQARAGSPDREPMTLDQLVAYAATAPGDANGVRVRIARTPAALAAAEAAVMKRLSETGLTADQIDARRQLVE